MNLLSIADVDISRYPHQYEWFEQERKKNKIEPTYIDYDLKEDLWSVDALDEYEGEIPDWVQAFIKVILATSEDTAYFRFIKY